MKNSIIIIWLTILLTLFSCKTEKKNENTQFDEKDILNTWEIFLNIIESKNKEDFKNISNEKIRCYLCLENTLNEQLEIENLRANDSLWYDKIYDDLIYIPIDRFLNNDFDLIFTPAFVSILKVKKLSFLKPI